MDLDQLWQQLLKDAPLAGVLIYIAREYMKKHEAIVDKLIEAFKNETMSCRDTNERLLEHILENKNEDRPQR